MEPWPLLKNWSPILNIKTFTTDNKDRKSGWGEVGTHVGFVFIKKWKYKWPPSNNNFGQQLAIFAKTSHFQSSKLCIHVFPRVVM